MHYNARQSNNNEKLETARCLEATMIMDRIYSPSQTGAHQLSSNDVQEKVGLLSAYPRNYILLEALQELRDDLVDSTARPVIV